MNYNRKSTIRFRKCIITVVLILVGLTCLVNKVTTSAEEPVKNEIKVVTETAVTINEPLQNDMPQYDISLNQRLQEHIWNQCNYMEFAYELELGVLYTESEFNPSAVNYNGTCRGMGQLSRETGERVANVLQIDNFWNENVFDAEKNVDCSIYHLWELRQEGILRGYTDEENCYFILTAYNRGILGADRYFIEHGTYESAYADKVLEVKSELEQFGKIIR